MPSKVADRGRRVHEPKILHGESAGDPVAFWRMTDSDNVVRVSRYMCGTTEVFPQDARDLQQRTIWYSEDLGKNR